MTCAREGVGTPASWARCVGTMFRDDGHAVAVDGQGNIYLGFSIGGPTPEELPQLAGCYGLSHQQAATAMFEDVGVVVGSQHDPGIAKYRSDGSLEWVRTAVGVGLGGEVRSIAVDPDGQSVVIAGDFRGMAVFSPQHTLASAHLNLFVAEYDNQGNVLWAQAAEVTPDNEKGNALADVHGVAIDPQSHNIVATGVFVGGLNWGGRSIESHGNSDMFTVELTRDGTILWLDDAGGQQDAGVGNAVTVEPDGSVVVVGSLGGAADEHFTGSDGREVVVPPYGGEHGFDMVMVRYDPQGRVLWATHAGFPNAEARGMGVTHDSTGNLYVTGLFQGCAWFRQQAVAIGQPPLPPAPPPVPPPPCAPTPTDLMVQAGGEFEVDLFVAKYGVDGSLQWVQQAGGPGRDAGQSIVVHEPSGSLYVGGTIAETAVFGQPPSQQMTVAALHDSSHAVAQYGLDGQLRWARALGGMGGHGENQLHGLAVDPNDGAVVGVGSFNGSASFMSGVTLHAAAEVVHFDDILLWRLGPDGQ